MNFTDEELIAKHITAYTAMLPNFIDPAYDNNICRKILPQRKIDEAFSFDEVETIDREGRGAQILPKGASPRASTSKATPTLYELAQIVDGFNLHEKDLKANPELRARNIQICLTNLARKEDYVFINGDALHNINGIVQTAQSNPLGKITAAGAVAPDVDNVGSWDGLDAARDIHQDVLNAIARVNARFTPKAIMGNRTDILNLFALDSQRQPYYKTIAPLFGKSPNLEPMGNWIFENASFTAGKVYVAVKDILAAELVVSENPKVVGYAKQPGEIYPFDVLEWVRPEWHNVEGFVEIDVT